MMGANPAGLANLIKTHAGAAPPAESSSTGAGAGAGLSASGSASAPAEPGVVSRIQPFARNPSGRACFYWERNGGWIADQNL
jgi:hypothetical protein